LSKKGAEGRNFLGESLLVEFSISEIWGWRPTESLVEADLDMAVGGRTIGSSANERVSRWNRGHFMEAIGRRRWAIAEGYIPSESAFTERALTLCNMRANGVRSLDVSCLACQHETVINADKWSVMAVR
jgi:hypothetical protein